MGFVCTVHIILVPQVHIKSNLDADIIQLWQKLIKVGFLSTYQ